ncbi:hypothetical protein FS837_002021 [Tulasnella sp. UAMH 9824]|nr:hypothetical protein FS837_002021 [Tulasnella sp. UAMH 9824]
MRNAARQTWLKNALTKHTNPSQQPPLPTSSLGTCDLEVGPHIFSETKFFEVTNPHPPQPIYPPFAIPYAYPTYPPPSFPGPPSFSRPYYPQSPNANYRPSSTPGSPTIDDRHRLGVSSSQPNAPTTPSYPPVPVASSPSPLSVPPQPPDPVLSPSSELVAQLDAAAQTDEELARLLSRESEGDATPRERDLLAKRIVEVAKEDHRNVSTPEAGSPSSSTSPQQMIHGQHSPYSSPFHFHYHSASSPTSSFPPNTEILVEFAENTSDRFVLPLSNSIVKRSITNSSELDSITGRPIKSLDILISTILPASTVESRIRTSAFGGNNVGDCYPVTIKLVGASSTLWLAISKKAQYKDSVRTARISKVLQDMRNADFYVQLNFVPTRVYLQHRLPEGHIINGLRDVVFEGRNPFKRKDPPSLDPAQSSEPATKKPKYPTRPSGRQVEVVIPLRRSKSTSTSSGQANVPSRSLGHRNPRRTRPTPGLTVEVVIPVRKKRSNPAKKSQPSPSTSKEVPPTTPTQTATTPPVPLSPVTSTRTSAPQGGSGVPYGRIPYGGYYAALTSSYPGPSASYRQGPGTWLYPWSPAQTPPYYSYGQAQQTPGQSGSFSHRPFIQSASSDLPWRPREPSPSAPPTPPKRTPNS